MSALPTAHAGPLRHSTNREIYIDVFRGLMALVMVQGHVMDFLLTREAVAQPWYVFQLMFHGSTAPGFLFASGFVSGLPRSPLSLRASARRTRRLLFVFLVGYFLHLPYFSIWKTLGASSAEEKALLLSCDALQLIALTQLFVIALQWLSGRHWTRVAAALAVVVVLATPFVWSSGLAARLPDLLAPYLDVRSGSRFPLFPFAAFVLGGTLAGAALGRAEPRARHRRAVVAGGALLAVGALLAWALGGRVEFWGPSPAYSFVRLGGLLWLMRVVEIATRAGGLVTRALALLGHETLLVYVLHLYLLFGGVFGNSPLAGLQGRLGFGAALLVVLGMVPLLLAASWAWRAAKHAAPQEARLALVFLVVAFLYEFLVRAW
ncbi:MAG: heparan-alpha-glucosaminide N-acetyltransferase domain-containing protein [Betaproteobacteria bacterium]